MGIKKLIHIWDHKAWQRGKVDTGTMYIIVILLILFGIAYLVTGPSPTQSTVNTGTEVVIGEAQSEDAKARLQLYTFAAATITPPASSVCSKGGINTRPEILVYSTPKNGEAISIDGQIKVWANDTAPLLIAPGERITRNSGAIIAPGDRAAKAPDGYIWAPALYIFPQTVDAGGQPYFPSSIRGDYNNGTIRLAFGIERLPASIQLQNRYTAQYIWNVKDLGLQPGSYQLQFVIHDGGTGRAVKCISMRVYENPDKRWTIPD